MIKIIENVKVPSIGKKSTFTVELEEALNNMPVNSMITINYKPSYLTAYRVIVNKYEDKKFVSRKQDNLLGIYRVK